MDGYGWRRLACVVLAALVLAMGIMALSAQQAQAGSGPFESGTCPGGYGWLQGFVGDLECGTLP